MNIIWKRPDGGISVTHLTSEGLEAMREKALADGIITEAEAIEIDAACRAHAAELVERGNIPADYELVAVNIGLPATREWRAAWTWTTPAPEIDISPALAVEVTKDRLRQERAPLLASLDVQFMRAIESGQPTDTIAAEKNRLRDITAQATQDKTLAELGAIAC